MPKARVHRASGGAERDAGRGGFRGLPGGGGEVGEVINIRISYPGLGQLRRDLRGIGNGAEKAVNAVMAKAAQNVANEARGLAPHRTGRLAASYRGVGLATRGQVRSNLYYAGFQEYGFHPGGGSTFVGGRHPVERALEHQQDAIVNAVAKGLDDLARAHGFR